MFFFRDPAPFEVILEYLRTGRINDRTSVNRNFIRTEAAYFQLLEMLEGLYEGDVLALVSHGPHVRDGAVICISGLPPGIQQDVLKKALDKSGELIDVGCVSNNGTSFVTVTNYYATKIVANLDGTSIEGAVVKVECVGCRMGGHPVGGVIVFGGL